MKILVDLMTRDIVVCIMYGRLMVEPGVDEASQVRVVDKWSIVLLIQRAVTILSIPSIFRSSRQDSGFPPSHPVLYLPQP